MATVYLVIPPAKLQGAIRFVRGTVGLILQSITRAAHPLNYLTDQGRFGQFADPNPYF